MYEVHGVEGMDAPELDHVLEVPADDEVGSGHGGKRHVESIDPGGRWDDLGVHVGLGQALGFSGTYDLDGNLMSRGAGETFTFDATNRLTGYTGPGGSSSYVYDPFGRRIAKTVSGATTFFLWDGDRLLGEYDDQGQLQIRYAYGEGFAPVEVGYGGPSSETVYAVHSDHLDTPRMLTDGSGAVVWRAAYEAYGAAHLDEDPDGDLNQVVFNVRFPGRFNVLPV